MSLRALVNIRIGLIVLAALAALFGFRNGFVAVFFPAKYEVTWNYDVIVLFCAEGQCAYSAALTVANTGREAQDLFTLQARGLPPNVGAGSRVTNLSALDPRAHDPEISQTWGDGRGTLEIRNFAPGALIEVWLQGSFPLHLKPAADAPEIDVQGKGRMIEGDPRAIAFGRFISQRQGVIRTFTVS